MNKTITPRPHAELAIELAQDASKKCYMWVEIDDGWFECNYPAFADCHYHVGHTAPTKPPQKMATLGGLSFPVPMSEGPDKNTECFFRGSEGHVLSSRWNTYSGHQRMLELGMIQATRAGAIAQEKAMQAALMQAIEGAR